MTKDKQLADKGETCVFFLNLYFFYLLTLNRYNRQVPILYMGHK